MGHAHETKGVSDSRLVGAIGINLLLTVVEVVIGLISGSLALLADAAHNFNDCASLVVTLVARRVSRKEADRRRTFGYRRAETIGAFVNLMLLTGVGLYLLYEAVSRYFSPGDVMGWPMIGAASVALVIDLGTVWFLAPMAKGGVNLRAGFLHKLADAIASVGVIVGGVIILLTKFYVIDLIITVGIAVYILWQSLSLLRPTVATLMESVPSDVDVDRLVREITEIEGVSDVHHVHVWELDEEHRAMEAHIAIAEMPLEEMERLKREIKQRVQDEFSIGHSTLEFELSSSQCDAPAHSGSGEEVR